MSEGDDSEILRVRLVIPAPLVHQVADFEAADRFKVLRWGRRAGKSRFGFIAGTVGHGPGWKEKAPKFPGIAQGGDVCWIGKNNPQTAQIWYEEILPRFDNLEGIEVNRVERKVTIDGAGSLHIRSAEAIASVRGIGANLVGVILDEAAHWPFLDGWRNELRPILMDNEGWAVVMSTTNGGEDGEVNELGDKIAPSGFNRLCLEIMAGRPGRTAGDGWRHSHKTARDNPKIKAAEFAATVREYPPGSISLAQEIEAKLVAGGVGLAFPEWRDDLHILRMEPPPGAVWFGGLDWGYHPHPCVFYAIASYGDRLLLYRHERMWRETAPYTVGYELGEFLKKVPPLEWIGCDPSTAARTTGPSILEELQRGLIAAMTAKRATVFIEAPRGPEQRQVRKLLLHEGLRFEERSLRQMWEAEGRDLEELTVEQLEALEEKVVPDWLAPKLRFHPDCTEAIATIPQLPRSPKGKEDVDTEAYDHPYDAATYPLMCRGQQDRTDDRDDLEGLTRDTHPGFTKQMEREDPWGGPRPGKGAPFRTGVRYRFNHEQDDNQEEE